MIELVALFNCKVKLKSEYGNIPLSGLSCSMGKVLVYRSLLRSFSSGVRGGGTPDPPPPGRGGGGAYPWGESCGLT